MAVVSASRAVRRAANVAAAAARCRAVMHIMIDSFPVLSFPFYCSTVTRLSRDLLGWDGHEGRLRGTVLHGLHAHSKTCRHRPGRLVADPQAPRDIPLRIRSPC